MDAFELLHGISQTPTPFVTPEDILLAKLYWFKLGGKVSEVQWRDIKGIVEGAGSVLDRRYLRQGATKLAVEHLLSKALGEP